MPTKAKGTPGTQDAEAQPRRVQALALTAVLWSIVMTGLVARLLTVSDWEHAFHVALALPLLLGAGLPLLVWMAVMVRPLVRARAVAAVRPFVRALGGFTAGFLPSAIILLVINSAAFSLGQGASLLVGVLGTILVPFIWLDNLPRIVCARVVNTPAFITMEALVPMRTSGIVVATYALLTTLLVLTLGPLWFSWIWEPANAPAPWAQAGVLLGLPALLQCTMAVWLVQRVLGKLDGYLTTSEAEDAFA